MTLMKTTREWITLGIFIHFGFTFWMYSNSAIFDTDSQDLFGWGTENEREQAQSEYSWIKINNRIKVYHAETVPVADFYDNQNKLHTIDGIGTIDGIFHDICEAIDQLPS